MSRLRPGGRSMHEIVQFMTAPCRQASWLAQAIVRIRPHWLLRTLGTLVGMAAFMTVYFWLLKHPVFPVTVMPMTGIDRWITFQSWSIVLYGSLWIYISLVPMLLPTRRELMPYLRSVTLLSLAGFTVFFFWPTAVPAAGIDWALYPSVAFLKSVDAAGNACPSLHVGFAVLTALWLDRLLKQIGAPAIMRALNVFWCAGIMYSTLATKQHVAIDVGSGALLGLAVGLLHRHRFPKRCTPQDVPEAH